MWSRERAVRRSARLALGAAAGLALLSAGACSVQPLYGSGPAGAAVKAALSGVVVAPVDSRVAQDLRNRLLFDLSGATAGPPRYRIDLNVFSAELALGVTPVETSPADSVTVTANFQEVSLATGEIVYRATSRQSASYDRGNQAFANDRARLDAETRAAVLVADDINLSLAAAAATGRI
jgi:LPS-assembly lipoprotein